jgi:hypothetical protein
MMSGRAISLRFFVFEPDGKLRCVSKQSVTRLVSRQGAIPRFSGQRLRDVEVTAGQNEAFKLMRVVVSGLIS